MPIFARFFLTLLIFCFSPAFGLEVTWYGHSAFKFKGDGGTTVLIDPWITNLKNPDGAKILKEIQDVDFILITHGHGDHLGNTPELLKQTQAKIITSYSLANQLTHQLKIPPERIPQTLVGDAGGEIQVNEELRVIFTQARHSSELLDRSGSLLYAGPALGFILKFKEGKTIYHSGDTDLFLDLRLIPVFHPVDLFLVCIGGQFTMGPQKAAFATVMIKPKTVIPMHYGTYSLLSGTTEDFRQELDLAGFKGEIQVPAMNQVYEFEIEEGQIVSKRNSQ
jgi:L-ascorbate metabolism protein UlaG (beta-lactamase superfamily)